MEDFIGKYDGNQIDSRLDKVKDMVGATASEAGASGLVPAPAKGGMRVGSFVVMVRGRTQ